MCVEVFVSHKIDENYVVKLEIENGFRSRFHLPSSGGIYWFLY